MKSAAITGFVFLFTALCSAPAFSQGSGHSNLGNSAADDVAAQQEEITRPCNDLTGWDKVACIKNRTKELFSEAHPCTKTAMERPCSSLAGPKRAECIKEQLAECRAKRQEFKAERKERFMENHPCASAAIFTPCSSMTGDAQKTCREEQKAKCKAKHEERKEARQERRSQRKEKFMENHPCAAGAIFTPCNSLTGAALRSCRAEQTAKCKAKSN